MESQTEEVSLLMAFIFRIFEYLASNKDLIDVFGLNSNNAKLHYINGRANKDL